jgi:two-component system chemotaxis sensor kinase CheA
MDELEEILQDFLIESFEMLDQLDNDLIELEINPTDVELLNRIFRVAHTIKGASSFLNFDNLTELTHYMENILNLARQGKFKINSNNMDIILSSIDNMKLLLIQIKEKGNDKNLDVSHIIKDLINLEKSENNPTNKNLINKNELNDIDNEESKYIKNQPQTLDSNNHNIIEDKIKKESYTEIDQTIRVDVKRLDHLMNLIGELVLGKNRLIKINDDVEERYEGEVFLEELTQVVSIVSLVTTDLQIAVMKTRMLQIGKIFNKFPRMIRDLSKELNKKIELEIIGEETELDKSILEEIGDPLVHIIRNSCVHGIETSEERDELGKDITGKITLKAYHEGNNIVIEIKDDGKGLNPLMLKEKAIEKGLMSEKEIDNLTNKETYNLIFHPGFSTAKAVTSVYGRGVGMDVVKTNIEKLNGIIDIESEIDVGTSIKLKIPLTLAIIQSLLVGVQEECYAIPLTSVIETVRISNDEIYTVQNKSVIRLREDVLPLIYLTDIFDVENSLNNEENFFIVVLGLGENKIGLVVDSLIGQEEIVIKSLGEYLQGIEGISGATIRGDGGVTLIIDIAAIMTMGKTKVATPKLNSSSKILEKTTSTDYQVLIVDDSKTDRHIMKSALNGLNITIIEAVDGQDALNIIKQEEHQFDAILIDIEMPKMDGYTLASTIKKFNKYKNLPLIAVTSRNTKNDRMRGIESGMIEYVTKPYSPDYLMEIVKRNIKFKEGL